MAEETTTNLVELATDITIAWLGNANNRVAPDDVPAFLRSVHATVSELSGMSSSGTANDGAAESTSSDHVPAVTARKSLASKDHIISMIDGKPYKTLRRHLTTHGLTPEDYRARYNLKKDYPMVAENYAATRRALALKIGLGSKGRAARAAAPAPAAAPAKPAAKRGGRSRQAAPAQ